MLWGEKIWPFALRGFFPQKSLFFRISGNLWEFWVFPGNLSVLWGVPQSELKKKVEGLVKKKKKLGENLSGIYKTFKKGKIFPHWKFGGKFLAAFLQKGCGFLGNGKKTKGGMGAVWVIKKGVGLFCLNFFLDLQILFWKRGNWAPLELKVMGIFLGFQNCFKNQCELSKNDICFFAFFLETV